MQTLRLSFSKLGDACYISHLDLHRCFSRAITQSKLNVWYTEGFNSHLYLTFPLPLSLGLESVCEIVDFRVLDEYSTEDVLLRVNAHLPRGIECFNCGVAVKKPKEIVYARYLVEIKDADENLLDFEDAMKQILDQNSIVVEKTSKKGKLRELDLKPMIFNPDIKSGEGVVLLDLTLPAGSENNINPLLFLNVVFKKANKQPESCSVRRTQVLTADFKNFE